MSSNGMNNQCACLKGITESKDDTNLILLSRIPNQQIYRCNNCHTFLSYTEDLKLWEVLLQGNIEEELKTLYPYEASSTGVA
ncbi:hypothetical protein [Neptuniibacter sp.]|uniref:hypothetical protein n=1 Tax=Neptuniibacter sp. TaxID=1962643 RepID=UPI003B5B438B